MEPNVEIYKCAGCGREVAVTVSVWHHKLWKSDPQSRHYCCAECFDKNGPAYATRWPAPSYTEEQIREAIYSVDTWTRPFAADIGRSLMAALKQPREGQGD